MEPAWAPLGRLRSPLKPLEPCFHCPTSWTSELQLEWSIEISYERGWLVSEGPGTLWDALLWGVSLKGTSAITFSLFFHIEAAVA